MLTSLLKMLLAHFIGDFMLQPKSWVDKRSTQIQYLFYHIGIHALLLTALFIDDLKNNWQNILFLTAAHLAIDSLKIGWESRWNNHPVRVFLIDQSLHIICIFALCFFRYPADYQLFVNAWNTDVFLMYLIAILLIVFVIPIVIRVFFTKWNRETEFNNKRKETLFDAGTLIGITERALILCFIMLDFMEGIGFLLAAKSIFRFGDLSNARDTKFTEYVLIGTMLSFVLGTLVALGLKSALTYLSTL